MPYKDPARRREYHRNYKRKLRGLTTPGQPKCYISESYISIQAAGGIIVEFNGLYITSNPRKQAAIEASSRYGTDIFSYPMEP